MDDDRSDPLNQPTSSPRGRHTVSSTLSHRSVVAEPGLGLVIASIALLGSVVAAVLVGWVALLFVMAVLQVFLARSWVAYLEVPGSVHVAAGVLVVAAVADAGVAVARVRAGPFDSPDQLIQMAPALGVVFLAAVTAQLVRRDGRDSALACLMAACTGGALAVGLAVWLPIEASLAGSGFVVVGVALGAGVGVVVGMAGWIRHVEVPAAALLLPVLLGVLSGPLYALGRVVAG